jgi:hypothetical protein
MTPFTADNGGNVIETWHGEPAEFETLEDAIREMRAYYRRLGETAAGVDIFQGTEWIATIID